MEVEVCRVDRDGSASTGVGDRFSSVLTEEELVSAVADDGLVAVVVDEFVGV